MRSDIFNDFVKVAKEKGLIKEHTEKNTESPRWDSLDDSAIAALYGVKPDAPKGMEYEKNITELAHPNSVIISPSYDKLNGLVENDNERQNILLHILYKEPESGSTNQGKYPLHYSNPKYANKQLLLSLVRVANLMDDKDQNELRILADVCLAQAHQTLQKKAILPWIIGAAVILAVTYAQQHLSDTDKGIRENYIRLQKELQDFLQADITVGMGHKYDESLKNDVQNLQSRLNEFWTTYSNTLPLLQSMEKPRDASETLEILKQPQAQNIMQAYQSLRDEVSKLYPYLDKVEQNFNDPDYKAEHTAEKGSITSLIDSIPFFHGGKGSLTADDFDDVINAIAPFKESVKRLLSLFIKAKSYEDKIKADLTSSSSKTDSELGPNPFVSNEPAKEKTVQDIDNEASGLLNQIDQITQ